MIEKLPTAAERVKGNAYPGRGIAVGASEKGEIYLAYFIMGRSENSRNRVLATEGDVLMTRPFDESKVKDPSLIIYNAMRRVGDRVILTNGDQTDTAAEALLAGGDFFGALRTRTYEPDDPNYTPRISALIDPTKGEYAMSILRRASAGECERGEYNYLFEKGVGRLIHTYSGNGDPLPSFVGEPREIAIEGDLDAFAESLWEALDSENKIALFARSISPASGKVETRLFNKNKR